MLSARTPSEEALAIACALREAVERPGKTAALITPDRTLARRVASELRRWGIAIDDSAPHELRLDAPGDVPLLITLTSRDVDIRASIVRAGVPSPPADAPNRRMGVETLLVDLVVERTGFPRESITPEARLLDDLNLDSIKAAELVASAARQQGAAGKLDPSKLANATLADVAPAGDVGQRVRQPLGRREPTQQDRTIDILAGRRVPGTAEAATPSGLFFRHDHGPIRSAGLGKCRTTGEQPHDQSRGEPSRFR